MELAQTAPIKVLVAGSGFGCRIPVPALRGAGFEVVGLVGADAERTARRAERNGIAQSFTDISEAIDQTGAQAVVVATPPATHAALALAAIEHGCHVLCEKPFAANLSEARAMLAAADQAGVVNMVGHEFRFSPTRALFARSMKEGLIGEPRLMALVEFGDFMAKFANSFPGWWFDPDAGGGWLGASGSHLIDQLRVEVGEIVAVSAALTTLSPDVPRVEDTFVIRLEFANGAQGVFQQTPSDLGPRTGLYRVCGSIGTLWTEDGKVWLADREGARELPMPEELVPEVPDLGDDPRQQSESWKRMVMAELAPYTRLCRQFRTAIEGGPLPANLPRPATFADGVACMAVIDAARQSAASGGALVKVAT